MCVCVWVCAAITGVCMQKRSQNMMTNTLECSVAETKVCFVCPRMSAVLRYQSRGGRENHNRMWVRVTERERKREIWVCVCLCVCAHEMYQRRREFPLRKENIWYWYQTYFKFSDTHTYVCFFLSFCSSVLHAFMPRVWLHSFKHLSDSFSLPFCFSFFSVYLHSINISCCPSKICLSITETRHTSGPIHHTQNWPECRIVCMHECVCMCVWVCVDRSFVSADKAQVNGFYKRAEDSTAERSK